MRMFFAGLLSISLLSFVSCTSGKISKEQLAQVIKENPEIVFEAIKAKPLAFMETVQDAAKVAQEQQAKKRDEEEKKELESFYEKPQQANIRKDESIRGKKEAQLVLVEYSDFECPYCGRAYGVVQELRKKYGDNIQFIYKHLPLSFHNAAMPAAQYYEAIRLQDPQKAWAFHDAIYEDQRKLQAGPKYLDEVAKKLKVDMAKLKKDINSPAVKNRIEEDKTEAAKFGFQGTPGFLLNGIPVKGAYPLTHFEGIVEELKKRGKVQVK